MTLKSLIDTITNVFDSHTCCLFVPIRSRESAPLKIVAWNSFSNSFNPDALIYPNSGLIAYAYTEQKSIHFNHFERDPERLQIYHKNADIKAVMIAPLPEKRGLIYVDSKNKHAFPDKFKKILENFARLAYNILDLLKEQTELEFYRRFSEFLTKEPSNLGDLVVSLIDLTSFERAIVISEEEGQFKLLYQVGFKSCDMIKNLSAGLVGWLVSSRRSFFISDSAKGRLSLFDSGDEYLVKYAISLCIRRKGRNYFIILGGDRKTIGLSRDKLKLLEKTVSQLIEAIEFKE